MGMLVRAGFAIGVIMVGGLFFSTVFKKKIEETVAPVIFSIITILYIFYCFDRLYIGYAFTLLLIAVGGAYSVFYTLKNKQLKPTAQRVLTAGFFAFLMLCVALYFITSKAIVQNWDDLRLWGAVPKVLFYDGRLQLGADATIFKNMQSYYPGMQLFAFFITKTMGVFYDGGIYFAYGVLGVSLLITVLAHCKKRFSVAAQIAGVIMLVLPLTFYNNMFDSAVYYLSLYIDPVLGMMCGYVFYLVSKDVNFDLFSQIRFCLSLVFIIQLKDSAILFAVVAILCALIMQLLKVKRENLSIVIQKGHKRSVTVWFIATAMPIALSVSLWKIQLSRFEVNTHIGLGAPKTDDPWGIAWSFFKSLFTQDLIQQSETPKITGVFTYFTAMLALVIISSIIYKIIGTEDKKSFAISAIGMFSSNLIFTAGLCYMYIGLGWDVFNSYTRYINTVLLAVLTFLVLYLMQQLFTNAKQLRALAVPAAMVLCIFFLPFNLIPQEFSPWINDTLLWDTTTANSERIATGIIIDQRRTQGIEPGGEKSVFSFGNTDEKVPPRVNYVMKKENTRDILHHTLYYALLDRGVRFTFVPVTESLRPFYTAATQEEQKVANENWLKGAEYVYIFDYDQRFVEQFGEYFQNGQSEIAETSLYKTVRKDDTLSLEYVVI